MKIIYLILGIVMLLAGVAGVVWALGTDSVARLGLLIGAASVGFVGIVFLFVAKYVGGLDDTAILRDGVPGTAQVLSVRDTGVTINNLSALIKSRILVTIPGRAPYEAEMRVLLRGRASWGEIQPGMTVPVKVDTSDHQKVVLDRERPVVPSMIGGLGTSSMAGGAPPAVAGGVPVVTMRTADIIARGTPTTGRLLTVEPTGMTAGAFAAGLPAEQANDPIVKVTLTFAGPDGGDVHNESLMRVPDGKAGYLASGVEVPIRYLPDAPTTATIDWDRL